MLLLMHIVIHQTIDYRIYFKRLTKIILYISLNCKSSVLMSRGTKNESIWIISCSLSNLLRSYRVWQKWEGMISQCFFLVLLKSKLLQHHGFISYFTHFIFYYIFHFIFHLTILLITFINCVNYLIYNNIEFRINKVLDVKPLISLLIKVCQ